MTNVFVSGTSEIIPLILKLVLERPIIFTTSLTINPCGLLVVYFTFSYVGFAEDASVIEAAV